MWKTSLLPFRDKAALRLLVVSLLPRESCLILARPPQTRLCHQMHLSCLSSLCNEWLYSMTTETLRGDPCAGICVSSWNMDTSASKSLCGMQRHPAGGSVEPGVQKRCLRTEAVLLCLAAWHTRRDLEPSAGHLTFWKGDESLNSLLTCCQVLSVATALLIYLQASTARAALEHQGAT